MFARSQDSSAPWHNLKPAYLQAARRNLVCGVTFFWKRAGLCAIRCSFPRPDPVIFDELRAIQLRFGYLPKAELQSLSERPQTPLYQIHSVASFYPHFHLSPPAKAEVRICDDMSCHLNGSCELRAELRRRFAGMRPEDVDMKDVSCLGRCDQAPAVAVNDEIFVNVNADTVENLARQAIRGDHLRAEHPHVAR